MKKRIAVIILAAMLATTSLFSCQGNNASSAPPAESAGGASSAGADTGISDPNVAEPGTFPVLKEPGKTKFTIGLSQDSNVLSYEEDNYHTPVSYTHLFRTQHIQDITRYRLHDRISSRIRCDDIGILLGGDV